MLKTITINTETHRVVPIEPTEEFFKLANIADFESWAGSCCSADNETIYHCVIESAPEFNESPWQPIETAPKDGTEFILKIKCGNLEMIVVTKYLFGALHGIPMGILKNEKYWMPLPEEPTK